MTRLLNGPIELAARLISVLRAYTETPLTRDQLASLDYALIHTGDFGGPSSLHPSLPSRETELAVKRDDVNAALQLLHKSGLIQLISSTDGIAFVATDEGYRFGSILEAPYSVSCRTRAEWLAENIGADVSISLDASEQLP